MTPRSLFAHVVAPASSVHVAIPEPFKACKRLGVKALYRFGYTDAVLRHNGSKQKVNFRRNALSPTVLAERVRCTLSLWSR